LSFYLSRVLSFTALHSSHKKQNGGKLVIYTSDEKKQLEVPYQANILHGYDVHFVFIKWIYYFLNLLFTSSFFNVGILI
jgi:hypothetical protein